MKKKLKTGIQTKIMSGYVLVIVMIIVSFFIIGEQFKTLQEDKNYIMIHDFQVNTLTHEIEKNILDMETGLRGFLITGDENSLQPYEKGQSEWRDSFDELYTLVDSPEQKEKLLENKGHIIHWIDTTGEPQINSKRQGNVGENSIPIEIDSGSTDMNLIRSQFNSFRETELNFRQGRADDLNSDIEKLAGGMITLAIIVFGIAITISMLVSRSIVHTINEVIETIKDVTTFTNTNELDLSTRIKLQTNDEIRDLGIATNDLLETLEQRDTHQKRVNNTYQSYQDISNVVGLGKAFISSVSEEINASYAALYVRDYQSQRKRFVKCATFADSFDNVGRNEFELGQGLIGEYALKKRMHVLSDLDNFQLIPSALGSIPPKGMMIAPILYDGEVVAVLELLSLDNFSELDEQYIFDVIDNFGVTLNSAKDREEIERLLTESQTMTEELRVQSDNLQTQSEELQMQSEELQTINEKLEERSRDAEQKSAALIKTKKDLEEKAEQLLLSSKYKSEFLANMSHELRTPLNSILILSELIAENAQVEAREEEENFANVIHTSGQDLLSLIDDILDLSKVEAGKMEIVYSEMNIKDLPAYLDTNFKHVADQKNIAFKVTQDENIPDVFYTDEKRMLQIVKNLLSNAFKYTEEGSVLVEIKNVRISELKAGYANTETDNWISFSVTDTGIGIPKEKHKLIFEAFQQADGATMRKYGGTGLGLSICHEYAKNLGGYITLDSEDGMGSTFTLYLPSWSNSISHENEVLKALDEVAASIVEEPVKIENKDTIEMVEPNVLVGKKVLIVDDDLRNIFALEAALKQEGMNVQSVNNGLECLEMLERQPFFYDIILMDIMMPNMDGYETMQKIRMNEELAHVPIIALTAKAMKQDRKKCIEAGASDYVSKPLNMEQLLSVLSVWVSN